MRMQWRFDLQRFAEEQPETPETTTEEQNPEQPAEANNTEEQPEEKLLTQAEFDKAISRRLNAERKKWEKQAEEDQRKAAMSEAEKLETEKQDAEARAQQAEERANQVLVNAEAKATAAALGVNPARLGYAVRLAELDDVAVEEGEVDTDAITKALNKVLEDIPELKVSSRERDIGGGTNPGSRTSSGQDMNAFIRRSVGR